MTLLNINEKNDSQLLIENLQDLSPSEFDSFASRFAISNEPSWCRFIKGAYNHPVTWWIGIFQLQMQMGLWGYRRKSEANLRANMLWQVTQPLRNSFSDTSTQIFGKLIKYNLKYRKADISGRLAGGMFTNYASTGGRAGKAVKSKVKFPVNITNFILASYGAAIKAIATGNKSIESVIQSVLTGRVEVIPASRLKNTRLDFNKEELELLERSEIALSEVMSLSQVLPVPVPFKEFCLRPENINIEGLCK